jgi:hypothetical protein
MASNLAKLYILKIYDHYPHLAGENVVHQLATGCKYNNANCPYV